ncbi:tyrosine-type recombinase/integrase [Leucobacter sp. W1038]|uniref:tyrosine-type recombinase/integrase n=1 Tax=Leucobacter sp. W1038 TaxID=3438281 RepID=UPI003D9645FF
MGSVFSYAVKTDKKPRYAVMYRDPTNKQVMKRGFTRKRDAEQYLNEVEGSKHRGEYVDPHDAKATIGRLGAQWIAARKSVMKPSSYRPVDSAWRIHVEPKWGQRGVGGIRHSEVQAWVSELSTTLSATTVLRAYGVLAAILDIAVKDRRLTRNVARDVSLPRKTGKAKVYLTHEMVDRLARESQYPNLVLFLAYTGLRWGEATGLRVRNVDMKRRRVSVEENAVMVGSIIEVGTPKTHESRSVPFPAFLAPAITEAMKGKRDDQLLWGDGVLHMRLPNSVKGWFAGAVQRLREADQTAAAEAEERGEEPGPVFPRVTPHDLRHTAASLAISAGANVKAVQRMLGHASAAMTLDVYSELFDDDLDTVADALDQARARSSVSTVLAQGQSGNEETPELR